jgi:hypothetical protein
MIAVDLPVDYQRYDAAQRKLHRSLTVAVLKTAADAAVLTPADPAESSKPANGHAPGLP